MAEVTLAVMAVTSLATLLVVVYGVFRSQQAVVTPYIRALGDKEGELIVLRAALNGANQSMAQLRREAEEAKKAAKAV